jgi:hypothetical protein
VLYFYGYYCFFVSRFLRAFAKLSRALEYLRQFRKLICLNRSKGGRAVRRRFRRRRLRLAGDIFHNRRYIRRVFFDTRSNRRFPDLPALLGVFIGVGNVAFLNKRYTRQGDARKQRTGREGGDKGDK